jgi:hypothetical protein
MVASERSKCAWTRTGCYLSSGCCQEVYVLKCTNSNFKPGCFHFHFCFIQFGSCGSLVVKALCYKPEGRGFKTQ